MSDTLIHVVPVNDTIPHRIDLKCCDAYVDVDGLAIHHAYDKRECYERVGRIGKGWQLCREEGKELVPLQEGGE